MRRTLVVVAVVTAAWALLGAQVLSAPPAPPSSVTVVNAPGGNGHALKVTIGASPDDGSGNNDVTRYMVWRRKLVTGTFEWVRGFSAGGLGSYELVDTGLEIDTRYFYRVAAYNGEKSSFVVGAAKTADKDRPRPPKLNVTDRPGDQGGALVLTIAASRDDGKGADDVRRYLIRRRDPGGTFQFLRGLNASDKPTYVIEDTGLENRRRYDYRVMAWDGKWFSRSAAASGIPYDNTRPRPPRNLIVKDFPGDQGQALALKFLRSRDDGMGARDVLHYRILRKEMGERISEIARIRAKGADSYEYVDRPLVPRTTYLYRVRAWDGARLSAVVEATGAPQDNRRPAPPGPLAVKDHPGDNGDALDLVFKRSRNERRGPKDVEEYHIFRGEASSSSVSTLTLVAKVPADGSFVYKHVDNGLTRDQKYRYKVQAFDGQNLSTPVFGTGTPTDNTSPRPPGAVTVEDHPGDNGHAVDVSFRASPDDGKRADDVVSYEVSRKKMGEDWVFVKDVTATDSTLYQFTDTGLDNFVLYSYKVRAFDGANYSVRSIGSGKAIDNTAPRPPRKFAVALAPNSLGATRITFDASKDDTQAQPEVREYQIFRKRAGGGWPGTPTLTVRARQWASYSATDTGLNVGVKYDYRARAKAGTGFSPWTLIRSIVARDTRESAPPRNLRAEDRLDDNGQAVNLRWDRSADDGMGRRIVDRYVVFRQLTSVFDPPVTRVKSVSATGAASYSTVDTSRSLMNLRSYTYWVVAVTKAGARSRRSNEATAVPRDNLILAPPTNLRASDRPGGGNAIDLSWTRSTSESGTVPPPPPFGPSLSGDKPALTGDYEVFRRKPGNAWAKSPHMVVSSTEPGDPLKTVDTRAKNGVRYEYRVRFRVGTAISPFSNTAGAEAHSSVSSSGGTDEQTGLAVTITGAPEFVRAGQAADVRVTVEGEGLSLVALEWSAGGGEWRKTASVTGNDSYEANFTLAPGAVEPGGLIRVVAVASDAEGEARSEQVAIEVTE